MGISNSIDVSSESASIPWHPVDCQDEQQAYVALYAFEPENTWGAQQPLSLTKGTRLRLISQNSTREWCEVEQLDGEESVTGWVPRSYVAPESSLTAKDWYHGEVDRATAEFLLGSRDGTFLVRKGISQPGTCSLSVLIEGSPSHFRIINDLQGNFYIDSTEKFLRLSGLIDHYHERRPDVRVWLREPAIKIKPTVYTFSPDDDEWEIDRDQLTGEEKIGEGSFGIVAKAKWEKFGVPVAIKKLREQNFTIDQEEEFRNEAEAMKAVKHPNLIQLLGVSTTESPFLLISELMHEGDLSKYLRQHDETNITWSVLLHMAVQVSMGMEYLEERSIVHRDLAGRNCFVGEGNVVKVGDFGLSRFTFEEDVYQGGSRCLFPFKWTAPEGILDHLFTSKSDVWSFGVLLWEIATLGKEVPYSNTPNLLLILQLKTGVRLKQPRTCPNELYQLMQDCWNMDPEERPSFHSIRSRINAICHLVRQLQAAMEYFQAAMRT